LEQTRNIARFREKSLGKNEKGPLPTRFMAILKMIEASQGRRRSPPETLFRTSVEFWMNLQMI
jgi:hypothetical protein